jgi:phosphate transport system permease protein
MEINLEQSKSEQRRILTRAIREDRKTVFSRFGERPSYSKSEIIIRNFFRLNAYLTMAVTLGIIAVLLVDGVEFFRRVSAWEFFTGTVWSPFGQPKHLGVLPLISGTMMIAIGSSLVAIPLGMGTAIFLTLYAPRSFREIVTPIVEILGGIPTVVYGYFALDVVTPALQKIWPEMGLFNALSASIVVGISTLPMVSSLSAEAIRVVPSSIRNAGYALGMTKFHVVTRIVVPAALSGIVASFILAFSRAVGETMAVTLAAGSSPNMNWNYLESIQTMTAFIVQISLGDTPAGSIEYYTIYAIGLTLFVMTFAFNILALQIVRRFREVYK